MENSSGGVAKATPPFVWEETREWLTDQYLGRRI